MGEVGLEKLFNKGGEEAAKKGEEGEKGCRKSLFLRRRRGEGRYHPLREWVSPTPPGGL